MGVLVKYITIQSNEIREDGSHCWSRASTIFCDGAIGARKTFLALTLSKEFTNTVILVILF